MIKIKNYIFNENEIREIKQCKNYLRLDLTYSGPYLHIDDATFEDIEWNYGVTQNVTQNNKIDDEYIELSNKYQRLLNRNEELKEENNKLESENVDLHNENVDLKEENRQLKELNVCVGCENNPDYKTKIKALEEHNKELVETNYDLSLKLKDQKEENKKLKKELEIEINSSNLKSAQIEDRKIHNDKLKTIINKAIEYILNTDLATLDKWKVQEILKGEE